jgi:hypothetical protein
MDLLPARIGNPEHLRLLGAILSVGDGTASVPALRARLLGEAGLLQALVALAEAQGVLAPVIWSLNRRHLLPPAPAGDRAADDHPARRLAAAYRHHQERRARQRDQLAALIAALNRAGIVPLLLKGARFLVDAAHPWSEARTMRDLDPLIRPDEAERAVAALEGIGYVSGGPEPHHHHLPALWLQGAPSAVEIHLDALAKPAQRLLATDALWRQAVERQVAGRRCFLLPDAWQLLHSLLHHQVSDRGQSRRILALKPLWEFAWLAAGLDEAGWAAMTAHLRDRGALELLGDWMAQAEMLYGLPPREPGLVSPAAAAAARRTMAHARAPGWVRRGLFLADQLAFGFSRGTLARRYAVAEAEVSATLIARHLAFLLRRYRGQMAKRLLDRGRRPS